MQEAKAELPKDESLILLCCGPIAEDDEDCMMQHNDKVCQQINWT
jgi:hypothetical protein